MRIKVYSSCWHVCGEEVSHVSRFDDGHNTQRETCLNVQFSGCRN